MNHHHSKNTTPEAQAVLPHVRITVTDTGTLDVSVDGTAFPAPVRGVWSRERFGELLDAVTRDRTIAVRVEVREVDGAVFTDLIESAKPVRRQPLVIRAELFELGPFRAGQRLVRVTLLIAQVSFFLHPFP